MRNNNNQKSIKKINTFSLWLKFLIGIFLIGIIITASIIIVGKELYRSAIIDRYYATAFDVTEAATSYFDGPELVEYAEIVKKYNRGEMSDEEIEAIRNSETYRRQVTLLDKLRDSMGFNDIYIGAFDVEVLKNYSEEAFKSGQWKPLCYIADSYYDKTKQFRFGDASRIQPEWREGAINLAETGILHNTKAITNGDFGSILTATNFFNYEGQPVAIIAAEIPMLTLESDTNNFVSWLCLLGSTFTLVICVIYMALIYRIIIRPVRKLSEEASTFVEGNAEISSDLEKIRNHDEIGVLSRSLLKMEIDIKDYIENITKITAEKERIGAELNVATQIQADMLPSIFPPFPERKEFDIYASMTPAKEVGGDFYDFFLVDDDHIALVMADVSGKGVPAALFMVIAKTLIKNRAQMGDSPAAVLMNVNEQLCEGNEAELFVTVWLAIIEISTGKGKAANAGHEHPILRRKDGKFELVEYRHSPAVATMEGIRFKEHEFEIFPGDTLFVYTDGVPEATNANNELFGSDRMLDVLNEKPDSTPDILLKKMRSAVDDFVGEAPQFDDLTMLGFAYYGTEGK
ncbi:MAG: PP2C family protein-serine/threonine phosphatase [Ruminiclostridium sp.]|nr:PP2C family protein-serine/threonine phosphatase [Ruminiclostridium sp.]